MLTVQVMLDGENWLNRDQVADLEEAAQVIAKFQEARNNARGYDLVFGAIGGATFGELPAAFVRVIDENDSEVQPPSPLV